MLIARSRNDEYIVPIPKSFQLNEENRHKKKYLDHNGDTQGTVLLRQPPCFPWNQQHHLVN